MSEGSNGTFDNYAAQASASRINRINQFTEQTPGLRKSIYADGGRNIWLLDDSHGQGLKPDQVRQILDRQNRLTKKE